MHRHGYKGRKFGRETDQRRALIKGLATSLVMHGAIETTLPKAKTLVPYVEVLITKAKKGDLHNRRIVMRTIEDKGVVHVLFTEIAPKMADRDGGYTRITKIGNRQGDNAPMAVIEIVEAKTFAAQNQAPKKPKTEPKATAPVEAPAGEAEVADKAPVDEAPEVAVEDAPSDDLGTDVDVAEAIDLISGKKLDVRRSIALPPSSSLVLVAQRPASR